MRAIPRYNPQADRDIDLIADFIADDSLNAALRFYAAVRADARKLSDMPGLGPVYGFKEPEYADVRFWPISGFRKYLIFYRPDSEGGVRILRVMHGARNLEKRFKA